MFKVAESDVAKTKGVCFLEKKKSISYKLCTNLHAECLQSSGTSVADPERYVADPDPTFYFDADPEPINTWLGKHKKIQNLKPFLQNLKKCYF